MQFRLFVKLGTIFATFLLVIITLITLTAFALKPSDPTIFTNALLLVMIMSQMLIVTVLVSIYEKIGGKKI